MKKYLVRCQNAYFVLENSYNKGWKFFGQHIFIYFSRTTEYINIIFGTLHLCIIDNRYVRSVILINYDFV